MGEAAQELVFTAPHTCEVRDIELPQPGPGMLRIRNHLGLISPGTELAMFTRRHRGFDVPDHWAAYPFRPGYASVGRVESLGEGVDGIAPGARVLHAGTHATLSCQPAALVVPLSDAIADERAVFAKLLQIALTPQLLSPVRLGEGVLVIGCGLVGNLAAQLCRVAGAFPIGVLDRSPARLALAERCGLAEAPAGTRAPYVVEAAGSAASVRAALDAVVPDGRVVILSSPREKLEIDPYFDIHHRGVQVIGAHEWRRDRRARAPYDAFVEHLLASERVHVDPLVSHRVAFGPDAQRAYEGLRDDPDHWLAVLLEYPG